MSYDIIHKTPRTSIYERTDYIVNSDMTIPFALAGTIRYGFEFESTARPGLPRHNREPFNGTPLSWRGMKLGSIKNEPSKK